MAIGQGAQALENGDIVIGRQAKSIASTEHGNPGSGAVVAGAEAAAYGARGDVVIGASAETNVKIKQSGGTVDPKYAQGVAIGSTAKPMAPSPSLSVRIREPSVTHLLLSAGMISIWPVRNWKQLCLS